MREGFYDYEGDTGSNLKDTQNANGTLNGTLNSADIRKKKIRELVLLNPKITRKQIAEKLEISERSVQRLLNNMPDIQFTGGGRNGHWEIVQRNDSE